MHHAVLFARRISRLNYLLGSVLLVLLFGTACSDSAPASTVHSFHGHTMGTSYSIIYVSDAAHLSAVDLQAGVDARLQGINQSMSTYISNSELNRLNKQGIDQWMPVSAPLFTVIQQALEISRLSAGAFDITVGPLVELWGFGPQPGIEQIPGAAQLSVAHRGVGYQAVELDSAQQRVRKTAARRLDLSAIAKGYATDVVADYLQQQGIENYLVEIGGEMRLKGHKPDGKLWRIAIERPVSDQRAVEKLLSLTDVAIATSGDYRNYFEVDGQRYSHTIDPVTGYPIRHRLVSVTVITDDCIKADGFATAMMVLGIERSIALAEQQHLAVLLLERTEQGFVEHTSTAFSAYLTEP